MNPSSPLPARPGLRAWLTSDTPASRLQARLGRYYATWRALSGNPLTLLGLAILLALVLVAAFAPWLAPFAPNDQDLAHRLAPMGGIHALGTDQLGRDILSRLIYGSRVTLAIIVLVAVISAPIGLAVGTIAGYFGGWVAAVLMRVTDIFMAFPRLILALAFVAVLGPGIDNAVIAIAITAWPPYARIARAETLTFRNADFVRASIVEGAGHWRILMTQIVPLCLGSMIVRVTLDMAGVILIAAGLGFLGLGAQPPTAEWGAMISTGRDYMLDQWWVAAMPGIAILLVSLAFNLLGDGLRDALDPRKRRS
jgi:peptide/nickel transport system permease protein